MPISTLVGTGLPLCCVLSNACRMSSIRKQFQIRRIFQEIIFTWPTKSHTRIVTDSYLNHLWKYLCHIFLISELIFCNVVCKILIKNSIETCILPYMKQIASPGSMHETGRLGPVHGTTLRDGKGRKQGGKWERGSGWGTHVHPWLIHVNVWQKPPQYCKVISLQVK